MALELPDLVKGACLAGIASGGLLPLTGFFAAFGGGLALRWYYDIVNPLKVGDPREPGRTLLQWGMVVGLATGLILLLRALAGGWLVPAPDALGPWLRMIVGIDGAALIQRHALRLLIRVMRPAPTQTSIIPELDARLPIEDSDGAPLPPMIAIERPVEDPPRSPRGDLLGLAFGFAMLWVAVHGWKMDSLCLLRLPD